MNANVQIFSNEQFGNTRIVMNESNEPMFCLKDLCDSLNLTNATVVAQRIDKEEVTKLDLGGQIGQTNFVTESGLYDVILRSDSPRAKRFTRRPNFGNPLCNNIN